MSWKKILYRLGNGAEGHFDSLKLKLKAKLGMMNPIQIHTYHTYCTNNELYIRGRVLENRETKPQDNDELWHNLMNTYRRFNSNEIPHARLKITVNGKSYEVEANDDGYYEASITLDQPMPPEELWHHPVIELIDAPVPFTRPVVSHCNVMTPPSTAQFGVISDIDDTILRTNATSLLKSAYLTFLHNARTRLPFEGVAAFYEALQKGITGHNYNPIFYVSSSPWNLYDLLIDFMELNKIPRGVIYLSDWGFSKDKLFMEGHQAHKTRAITNILTRFPHLNFILLGDSGQKDPEIYAQIVKDYPGRILCIYIRDVTLDSRDLHVKTISETLVEHEVEMVYAENSLTAAQHAVEKKFISEAAIPFINEEKKADEMLKPTVEELVDEEVKSLKL